LNLSASPGTLLARERELAAIHRALIDEDARLLTLTGPAGVGKTRLALEAAAQLGSAFSIGAVFVDLSPVRDPELVQTVLLQRLGFLEGETDSAADRLREHMQGDTLLLILDNFEHLMPASLSLPPLLHTCPGLKLLVTSRSPLQLQLEQIHVVRPLQLPDLEHLPPLDELIAIPSMALFLQRARARGAAFDLTEENALTIAELCVRLDGLPLALELAAARLNALPPAAILERLRDRLEVLHSDTQDLPDRHRSLVAAVQWSYALLNDAEQRLFRFCGAFGGRIGIDAMNAVLGSEDYASTLEGMASLAEKSLIIPDEAANVTDPGFLMLETMRECARELLEKSGEYEAARRAHAHCFMVLVERVSSELTASAHPWLLRLEAEIDNLRSALRWLLDHGEGELALRLATDLHQLWWVRGYHAEGWGWLEEAVRAAPNADLTLHIKGLLAGGSLLASVGEDVHSKETLEQAYLLAREDEDEVAVARALTYLGLRAVNVREWSESDRVLHEAIALWRRLEGQTDGNDAAIAIVLLGWAGFQQGNYEQAEVHLSESLKRLEENGNRFGYAVNLFLLANTAHAQGDVARAAGYLREGLEVSLALRDRVNVSQGTRVALRLLEGSADPEEQALLVGAANSLSAFTGFSANHWRLMTGQEALSLRERIEREGYAASYRRGQAMSLTETVATVTSMLDGLVSGESGSATFTDSMPMAQLLTDRERAVLRLVADGASNKDVGQELCISPATVSYHLNSIFSKLGAKTRAQAVAIGMREALFSPVS
jgi:predicted ATPase/DNA-binding CsgD family transcriptional regulator